MFRDIVEHLDCRRDLGIKTPHLVQNVGDGLGDTVHGSEQESDHRDEPQPEMA